MRAIFGSMIFFALAGPCASAPPTTSVPALDYPVFKQQVETELMGSCGFSNCHGAAARPMRIFALAGNRIRPGLPTQELTEEEHRANYDRVRSYAAKTSAELPDLLRKPLQVEQGGSGHTGVDRFGRNIYGSKADPRWVLLDDWVNGRLVFDAGPPDAGEPDAGMTDGGPIGGCVEQKPFDFAGTVGAVVNPTTCSGGLCHSPENIAARDSGCFDPSSCSSVRNSGCDGTRSVVPCNKIASKLYRYTGVQPFGRSHSNALFEEHAGVIAAWIDAGAPCD